MPEVEQVGEVLSGSTLPMTALALLLVDVAWLAWAWSVLSVVLELALLLAELVAFGRGWVRRLRRVVDRRSVPLVRRAVAAAFAVEMIGRTVSVAGAQPLPSTEPIVVASAPGSRHRCGRPERDQCACGDANISRPSWGHAVVNCREGVRRWPALPPTCGCQPGSADEPRSGIHRTGRHTAWLDPARARRDVGH